MRDVIHEWFCRVKIAEKRYIFGLVRKIYFHCHLIFQSIFLLNDGGMLMN
jgi:hypothetical protein